MRVNAPPKFELQFKGPDGEYRLEFQPIDDWDGRIRIIADGRQMDWPVFNVELKADGRMVLGGMTHGTEPMWGDIYWFELHKDDRPPVIRFYGDRVLVREDVSIRS